MSKLAHTVRWYQSVLRVALGCEEVPLNGNHNDSGTKAAMCTFQSSRGLQNTGFLSVSSNTGLTQIALEWIYCQPMETTVGKGSDELRRRIREIQSDYGLQIDGRVGPQTMGMMRQVLTGEVPLPFEPEIPKPASRPLLKPDPGLDGDELDTDIVLREDA
jgi:hypothetical protein